MSPSYVNILNVYAFCNTHDISWGTKGDDKISTDLGVAHTKEDGTLEVEIPTEEKDLDSAYETALQILATKAKPVKKKRSETEKQEDYYKGFRSSVVLTWMFSNGALCAVVLNVGGIGRVTTETGVEKSTIYLAVSKCCDSVWQLTTSFMERRCSERFPVPWRSVVFDCPHIQGCLTGFLVAKFVY